MKDSRLIDVVPGIGLIGCGAIGTELAKAIDSGKVRAKLLTVYDKVIERAKELASSLSEKPHVARDFEEFLSDSRYSLVIEAASQEAVKEYASRILSSGCDLMIMSVGALMDVELVANLVEECRRSGRRIYVPSGAIGGIDAIKALALVGIQEARLTTKKPPKALVGAPYVERSGIRLEGLEEETVLFEGSASEAVKAFPANVNVAAVLSLASLLGDKLKVRVVAVPGLDVNVHEIYVKSPAGELYVTVRNLPHPSNPKTSYLAALSAIETLRNAVGTYMRVGT